MKEIEDFMIRKHRKQFQTYVDNITIKIQGFGGLDFLHDGAEDIEDWIEDELRFKLSEFENGSMFISAVDGYLCLFIGSTYVSIKPEFASVWKKKVDSLSETMNEVEKE